MAINSLCLVIVAMTMLSTSVGYRVTQPGNTGRVGVGSIPPSVNRYSSVQTKLHTSLTGFDSAETEITPKLVTKQIMTFFDGSKNSYSDRENFRKYLLENKVMGLLDGMHIITILFQSARLKKQATDVLPIDVMTEKLATWDKEWSERDISTFLYGLRSLNCVSREETEFLKMAATKISLSKATLSSRGIGNALFRMSLVILMECQS